MVFPSFIIMNMATANVKSSFSPINDIEVTAPLSLYTTPTVTFVANVGSNMVNELNLLSIILTELLKLRHEGPIKTLHDQVFFINIIQLF